MRQKRPDTQKGIQRPKNPQRQKRSDTQKGIQRPKNPQRQQRPQRQKKTTNFAQYEMLTELGRGGGGIVFKARDRHLNRIVALKLIHQENGSEISAKDLFIQECRVLGRLHKAQHPNLVDVYHAGIFKGTHYISMEYVEGVDFSEILKRKGIDITLPIRVISDVSSALEVIHACGVRHGDLKPENIRLTKNQETKVLDFSVSQFFSKKVKDDDGDYRGTVDYLSPEQLAGNQVDRRSDFYSLGKLMYHALAGLPEISRDVTDYECLKSAFKFTLPPIDGMGREYGIVYDVMRKMLAKDPEDRYQEASELTQDIQSVLERLVSQSDASINMETVIATSTSGDLLDQVILEGPFFLVKPSWYVELTGDTRFEGIHCSAEVDDIYNPKNPSSKQFRIGRLDTSDIWIDHNTVSRHHATISNLHRVGEDYSFSIRDEGSVNGVIINKEKVDSSRIASRDLVEFAPNIVYVFSTAKDLMDATRKNAMNKK